MRCPFLRVDPDEERSAVVEALGSSSSARALVRVDDGGTPAKPTEVSVGWSEESLFVLFGVTDDSVVSPFTQRDDPVYEADAVEVFLDPWGHGRTYFEIDVSPHNVVFDALVVNRQSEPDAPRDISTLSQWRCDRLMTETWTTERGWSALLRIPLAQLALPQAAAPGTLLKANFFRIDASADEAWEYQALSPTGKIDFHRPHAFVDLNLGKESSPP